MNRVYARQGGSSLIVVLWAVAFLTLLTAQLIGVARQSVGVTDMLHDNLRLEAAADGAVFDTIMTAVQNGGRFPALNRRIAIGEAQVDVALQNEADKVDPNTASPDAIQAVLTAAGVDALTSARLARTIIDWRTRNAESLLGKPKIEQYRLAGKHYLPPNQPFVSLDEVGLVLGMTPDILANVRPMLSVVRDEPSLISGEPVGYERAEDEPGGAEHATGVIPANSVYQLHAIARLANGNSFHRVAYIRIKVTPAPGEGPYEVLSWETLKP